MDIEGINVLDNYTHGLDKCFTMDKRKTKS